MLQLFTMDVDVNNNTETDMTTLTAKNRVAQKLMRLLGEDRTIQVMDKHFFDAYLNYNGSVKHVFEYLWHCATSNGVER